MTIKLPRCKAKKGACVFSKHGVFSLKRLKYPIFTWQYLQDNEIESFYGLKWSTRGDI